MLKTIFYVIMSGVVLNFAGTNTPAPGIGGINIGTQKKEVFEIIKKSALFRECEITSDSNSLIISSKNDSFIHSEGLKISSIKVMFNKKKSAQALSVVCRSETVDAVEDVYNSATRLLGPAKESSPGRIGFKFEAEWEKNGFSATLFASDQAFETYLLIAYSVFVKEEELRGTNHPK